MNDTDKRTKSQGFDNLNKKNDPYKNIFTGMYNEMKLREKDEDTENLKEGSFYYTFPKFFSLVRSGGKWDHKPTIRKYAPSFYHKTEKSSVNPEKPATVFGTYLPGDKNYIYDYDIWSNIHYGYAGRMSGFKDSTLNLGAQIHDAAKGHSISDTFSDRNKDANAVKLGIKLYDKYGANLKKETLEKEIFENRASLNRYPRWELIEKNHVVKQGETVFTIAMENNLAVTEIFTKNPAVNLFSLDPGQIIILPSPDEIRQLSPAEYLEILNSSTYLNGHGAEHDALVEKMKAHFEALQKNQSVIAQIIEKLSENADTPTGTVYYVWETREDDRVRPEHAAREGQVFKWSDPPAGGNPGSEYGCRCGAHAFDEKNYETEQENYFTPQESDTDEQAETAESADLTAAAGDNAA